ncbi:MAG: NADPH-dependent F420 reductase [Chloroflexi bacterium]|nr:NADPH-dependent F420 reductase [Chloroflexota bacterium]|tara:strand:+ start:20423 stop:21073 length:651 start_codon:yes stop_codon:yes gene_type:complete
MKIGFIGGTGSEGIGLVSRFAIRNMEVGIGSRNIEKSFNAAKEISENISSSGKIFSGLNSEVASESDIVFVCVPYGAQKNIMKDLVQFLVGKIVVTVVVPVVFKKGMIEVSKTQSSSAAIELQDLLIESRVVSAFQTISARDLKAINNPINSDVVVCSDDKSALNVVMDLAENIDGIRAINGGKLSNSVYVENITPLLLNINMIYKKHTAIRITGV